MRPRANLTTSETDTLHHRWHRMKSDKTENLFENFDDFADFAAEKGYKYGKRLVKKDPDGPWSRENCAWVDIPVCQVSLNHAEQYKATVDFARQLIDHVKPCIPGPTEDNPNIMELCFHNGERNMKEKIIAKLMEHKTCVKGICHAQITWLIELLEEM